MYRRFGARVTVIEKATRLIPREDEDVSATIREILEAEGIDVIVDASDVRFAQHHNGFQVVPRDGAQPIIGTTYSLRSVVGLTPTIWP